MQTTYLQQVTNYFRNLVLNSVGIHRDLYTLLQDKDISRAVSMMQDYDDDVDEALKEYHPQLHKVMSRPDKPVDGKEMYITEKLPRTRQRYINDVELFFLLGRPITWHKDKGDDETFALFNEFLDEQYINSRLRQAKRLAGAETQSALLFHIYRDEDSGERKVKSLVLARSTGYKLRPLIDQYGNLCAFAYGYTTKEDGRAIEHWDFQTPKVIAYSKRSKTGWDVEIFPNPTGKINVIYFKQPKAWEGAQSRIEREEMLDSKTGDTNNYFADPIAAATADVIESMVDPNKPGKLIQLGSSNSQFSYINPPQSSQTRESEKADLNHSILFDTYTPDFDFEKMRGMGTLSGAAIRNAMILGYIKRDNRKEIYEELIGRMRNVILAIMKYFHPEKATQIDDLKISFQFSEPFAEDKQSQWSSIVTLYNGGLLSIETAIGMLALVDAPQEEIERIKKAKADAQAQGQAQAPQTPPQSPQEPNESE